MARLKADQVFKISVATAIAVLGAGCAGRALEPLAEQRDSFGGAPSTDAGPLGGATPANVDQGGSGTTGGAPHPNASSTPKGPDDHRSEAGAPGAAGMMDSAGGASAGDTGESAGAPGFGGSAGFAGFAPAPKCAGLTYLPSTPLITGAVGSVAIPRVIYEYTAPGLEPASAEALVGSDGTFAGIHITAVSGVPTDPMSRWLGVGLPLVGCVDASAFRGVKFTIKGDLGSCEVSFGLVTSVNNSDGFVGSCHESACLAASSAPLQAGTTVVLFSEMTGGSPESRVNPATLNDLQWQFTVPLADSAPACVADFTITELSFVGP
jgi:hypothetical protein